MSEPKETWKSVIGYEGLYEVSSWGRVYSVPRTTVCHATRKGTSYSYERKVKGGILKPCPNVEGSSYRVVSLVRDGRVKCQFVHYLVLEAFHGPRPPGTEACHFPDRDGSNNRSSNLRWDTPKANAADRNYHGTTAKGWKISAGKIGTEKRQAIIDLHTRCGYGPKKLGRIFSKPSQTIRYLISTYVDKA